MALPHDKVCALQNDVESERLERVKIEAEFKESTDRLTEAKDAILDYKQEIKQIRAHFEHYQTSVAEDRQQEREQFSAVKTQLNERIEDLSQQIKDKNNSYQSLDRAKQELTLAMGQLQEKYDNVNHDCQVLTLELKQKDSTIKQQISDITAYKEQQKSLEGQCQLLLT